MARVLVIIPAYNEEATIVSVIASVRAAVPECDIAVVDDGSSDRTAELVQAQGEAALLALPFNLGIGGGMQTGYKYATQHGYDVAIQVDADGQHDPAQIPALLEPIREGRADMVIGSRFLPASAPYRPPISRLLGMRLFAALTSLVIRQRVTDTTSGFRAVARDLTAFLALHYPVDFPDSEAIIMVKKAGFRIAEVPVSMNARETGHSSIRLGKSLYYPFRMMISIVAILLQSITFREE